MKGQPTRIQTILSNVGSILAAVFGLAVLLGGLWWLTAIVSPGWLRTWAMLATLALPIIAWASWRIGHVRSAALIKGIDTGIDKVSSAAQRMHRPTPRVQVANVLPSSQAQLPQITYRQLTDGEEEIVEL